jgi:hypothetical protein
MTRLLVAAALAAATLTTSAGADPTPVRVSYQYYSVPLDAGYLVVLICDASALPESNQQLAVATEVRCSAGNVTARAANPGGEAIVSMTVPVLGSMTVCVSGETAFVDVVGGHVLSAARGPVCDTLVP